MGNELQTKNVFKQTQEYLDFVRDLESKASKIFQEDLFNKLIISPQYNTNNTTVQGYPTNWVNVNGVYVANHTKVLDKRLSYMKSRNIFIPEYVVVKAKSPIKPHKELWYLLGWEKMNKPSTYQYIHILEGFHTLKEVKEYIDVDTYEFQKRR